MRSLKVTVQCMAVYNSNIEVPDNMTIKQAIEYAKEHIDEIPCGELEYISDSDELDEKNCEFEYLLCVISLKELYENGHEYLKYGGIIKHTIEDKKDFYDLHQNCDEIVLCDGESVEILQECCDFVLVQNSNSETDYNIMFSPEEFRIATFR